MSTDGPKTSTRTKAGKVTINMQDIRKTKDGALGVYSPHVKFEGFWTMRDIQNAQEALSRAYRRWRGHQKRSGKHQHDPGRASNTGG